MQTYLARHVQFAPRAITDSMGSALWQWPYISNPFGEKAPVSASGYIFNLRFPGQYFDAESGLNYNVKRDYEPASGRYIQSDPLGIEGGVSTFGYAGQNPLAIIDPSGLQAVPIPLPWTLPGPTTTPIDPILMPMSPADSQPSPWVTWENPESGATEQCPGPCKGLLNQLRSHQRKLRDYRANPWGFDNKGFLENTPPEFIQNIIDGRIKNLEEQIREFQKLYDACVAQHGGIA